MVIANQLREKNRVEYLLYLWQVEDILRAFNCDFESVRDKYLPQFKLSDDLKKQTEEWYQNLCEMMHSEGVMKVGHLQISKNVLLQLEDLHKQLMASAKFPYYHQMYFKVLPYVVELRGRGVDNGESELQICLDALYGVMLLRLKRQSVSDKTNAAVKDISVFLGQLSDYYFKDKKEPLLFE